MLIAEYQQKPRILRVGHYLLPDLGIEPCAGQRCDLGFWVQTALRSWWGYRLRPRFGRGGVVAVHLSMGARFFSPPDTSRVLWYYT